MTVEAKERTDAEIAAARQANRVRGLHHFAIGTTKMAETKAFYTGIVGLPHTQTWREEFPAGPNGPMKYMHCFFELGDGSALAFFQFAEGHRRAPEKLPREVFDHHIALRLDNTDEVIAMRDKLKAAKLPSAVIDHGYCYSLYTRDPNGMLVEFAADPDGTEELFVEKARNADVELATWLAGDLAPGNFHRSYEGAELPVSPLDEIAAVAIPPEHQ